MSKLPKDNSYDFDQFQRKYQKQELNRLKHKTSILHTIDQAAWKQAGLRAGMNVLDIGCGTGTVTQLLAAAVYPGQVLGIDNSHQMITCAWETIASANTFFEIGNAYDLQKSENQFDMVHARFLFQHLVDPLAALQQIHRVLKPGGTLCVVDVDDTWFTLYPEPSSFEEFRAQILSIQREKGGDPNVGRKLFSYFRTIGLAEIANRVRILDTNDCGTQTLIKLLSFGSPYYREHPDFAKLANLARQETLQLVKESGTWISIGISTATGIKVT